MRKTANILAIAVAVMGVVHIAATYSPVIAGKLSTLALSTQNAFLYMSLMCGALLLLGGLVARMLNNHLDEHRFLRAPFILTLAVLAVDGVLAPLMMPGNPCSWLVTALTLPLLVIGWLRR